ncbi:MAG: hypothetical protein NTZ14_18700 [Hyphomicrobiales bacterium]|nr:hypothetical protein [Hyphomicrobiales bacterium]
MRQHQPGNRLDEAKEDNMARLGHEVGPALAQRLTQVIQADDADQERFVNETVIGADSAM